MGSGLCHELLGISEEEAQDPVLWPECRNEHIFANRMILGQGDVTGPSDYVLPNNTLPLCVHAVPLGLSRGVCF